MLEDRIIYEFRGEGVSDRVPSEEVKVNPRFVRERERKKKKKNDRPVWRHEIVNPQHHSGDQWHGDRKEIRGAVMVSGYDGFRPVYIFHGPLRGFHDHFPFSSSSFLLSIFQAFEQCSNLSYDLALS